MVRDRSPAVDLFALVPDLALTFEPVLAREDDGLFQAVKADLARRAEEEARRRQEEEARRREWAQKPPAERVAGRLQFWLLGQRPKGREPDETEIAAEQAELLEQLPPAA